MKIAIIYFKKLQWTEEQLVSQFKKKDIHVDLIEINQLDKSQIEDYSLILNRIYASTANENNFNFNKFLKKLKEIENKGIKVINSSFCSRCDYSKDFATRVMKKKNINTPKTQKVKSIEEIKKLLKKEKNPLIFKPDTGGRGVSIHRIDNAQDIPKNIFFPKDAKSSEFIVQSLAKSIKPVDYRIFICGEEVLCVNTRTLVDGWLGSRSQGSKIAHLKKIPDALKKIAIDATKAIDSEINSLDVVETEKGFTIIENNPTPNFNQEYVDTFGFNPVEILVDHLIKKYIKPINKIPKKLGIIARIDHFNKIPAGDNMNYIKFLTDYFRKKRELVLIDWRDVNKNLEVKRYLLCNKDGIYLQTKKANLNALCNLLLVKQLGKIHKEKKDFLKFLDRLEKFKGKIINPIRSIKNNLSKQYLLYLQKKGFPVIPTIEIHKKYTLQEVKNLDFSFNKHYKHNVKDLIIKPKIFGEQGFEVRKLSSFENQKEFKKYLKINSPVIIQPLIEEIYKKGENSFVFLKKELIHAVNKLTGDFKINCREGMQCSIHHPNKKEIELCKRILEIWPDPFDYIRIDIIPHSKGPLVSEVEVVNPAFYIENVLSLKNNFIKKFEKFLLTIN